MAQGGGQGGWGGGPRGYGAPPGGRPPQQQPYGQPQPRQPNPQQPSPQQPNPQQPNQGQPQPRQPYAQPQQGQPAAQPGHSQQPQHAQRAGRGGYAPGGPTQPQHPAGYGRPQARHAQPQPARPQPAPAQPARPSAGGQRVPQGYPQPFGQSGGRPVAAHAGGYHAQAQQQPAPPQDPEAGRRKLGLALTITGCVIGLLLNLFLFILPQIGSPGFAQSMEVFGRSAILAYTPVLLYLFIPWLVDRYDPEPWWALAGVFLWGALFATGVSAVINTVMGGVFGKFFGSAISAPIFEELTKGMAIFGMVVFLRREFDGVVDGIIYGTFVAIGFAATENIIYYARFHGDVGSIFVLRGVLTPWLHPLFTAMTGIGFGLGREHGSDWAKVVFPFLGYCVGVFLHAWWNGIPQLFPEMGAVNLVFGILMALSFFLLIVALVYRKGKTIKKFLEDEVLIGTISAEEYDLITSYGGRLRARMSWRGKAGAEFVAAGARLALSKWHTARAMKGKKATVSMDFIIPLRAKLKELRAEMMVQRR